MLKLIQGITTEPIILFCFSCTAGGKRYPKTLPAGSRGTGTGLTAPGSCNSTSWVLGWASNGNSARICAGDKREQRGMSSDKMLEQQESVQTVIQTRPKNGLSFRPVANLRSYADSAVRSFGFLESSFYHKGQRWDRKIYQPHKFDKFTIKKFVPRKWLVHKEILRHFGTFTFSFRLFFVFFPVQILSFTGTQSAMGPRWPGHYFCQFEKRLPQPEIKSTRPIHLEIHFNPT